MGKRVRLRRDTEEGYPLSHRLFDFRGGAQERPNRLAVAICRGNDAVERSAERYLRFLERLPGESD